MSWRRAGEALLRGVASAAARGGGATTSRFAPSSFASAAAAADVSAFLARRTRSLADAARSAPTRWLSHASAAVRADAATDDDAAVDHGRVRNFAIIAHVDHGKTTLLDTLMKQGAQTVATERLMDNNALEKERGITISSKYTSFPWRGVTMNAVDTPGHADFGGEVERVLDLVDGCLLLVDATEGPMAQTKFVLGKALQKGLKPIVVMNKVDRDNVTEEGCAAVESKLFDLFAALGADDDQLDFATVYASAREGVCSLDLGDAQARVRENRGKGDMSALLDVLLERVPAPDGDEEDEFKMLVSMIEHDAFVGRLVTGRVASGRARVGDRVKALAMRPASGEDVGASSSSSEKEVGRITKIFTSHGGVRAPLEEARAGDIVSVAGLTTATVTDTVCAPLVADPLPATPIDPPTLKMTFGVNDSSLGGKEGKKLTGRNIWDRLCAEAETNVALRVVQLADGGGDKFEVQGRGELHLGVLIETMRREKFEMSISPPVVLYKTDPETGKRLEPIEEIVAEVEEEHVGAVIEAVTLRKGELVDMVVGAGEGGKTRLEFLAPSRGLIGFRATFVNDTRGTGTMNRAFHSYGDYRGSMDRVRKGAIVSSATGTTTTYALGMLEARGTLFVGPKTEVYEGMIIGENSREESMEVNPCKEKKLTNMRASGNDETTRLTPPRAIALEEAIGYVQSDELIEVTPSAIRLRKAILDGNKRKAQSRKKSEH